jgi:acyl carrier protein
MEMDEELRSRLLKIIAATAAIKADQIKDATRLFHDLSIKGDDVYWLLVELEKEFGTNLREFPSDQYFSDWEEPIGIWVNRFFGYTADKKGLTFGHLLNVVERGRWFDPPERLA